MIQRIYCGYVIICDNCEHQASNAYESWQDAIDAKEEEGFESKNDSNGWMDLCDECRD